MADEIIKAEQEQVVPRREIDGFYGGIVDEVQNCGFWASFSVEGREGSTKLYKATNSCAMLNDVKDSTINLVDVVFGPVTITNELGDVDVVMGVYLVDADGTSYMSTSKGVVNSAVKLLAQFGMPNTWEEGPLPIKCAETYTRRGYRYKYLDLIF